MANIAIPHIGVKVRLESGAEYNLHEGDIVRDLEYKFGEKTKKISGTIRVLNGTTRSGAPAASTECPPEPYLQKFVTVGSMVIDSSEEFDAELTKVSISNIVGIGAVEAAGGAIVVGAGAQYKALDTVIAEAEAGATIQLEAGEYNVALNLTKDIKIVGNNAILTGKVVVGDGTAKPVVEISGATLKGDALIELKSANEFIMKNCVFGGHNMTKTTQPVSMESDEPIYVCIEGCTFEAENEFSYNLINLSGRLKDGSSISNNKFLGGCCTHNIISLYHIDEGATIFINDNYADYSGNLVRIGFWDEPNCTVVMDGNEYPETDMSDDGIWAGLVIIQPGSGTTSFANMNVEISNTVTPEGDEQIAYMYCTASGLQLTDDKKPTIFINGVETEIPCYLPV